MNNAILIVDDMEINRVILAEGFRDEYEILEAENGLEAIKQLEENDNISAVLLDLVMPELDGMGVLKAMKEREMLTHIPVFIITAADSEKILMDAYDLGAVDVISKPFMINFLKCRIGNIIELYRHRNDMEAIIKEQIERLNKVNFSMIETLATLIEFRDGESGEHVRRICGLTDILMTKVSEMYPEYALPKSEIEKIVTASILHDVGKIAIPDSILNKPGRLTTEEYEIMKSHTTRGCDILTKIPSLLDNDIYDYVYDICRHHHERWDGRGYPDGLAGDEISIWAQVVAVADVYDALTSPRCYKSSFSVEKSVNMIQNGECGVFNPKILAAFDAVLDKIVSRVSEEKDTEN